MRAAPLLLACLTLSAGALHAQDGRVSADRETLRATPAGTVIATLARDAPVRLGERRTDWRQVTLDAWIWGASVRGEQRDGHDLVVSVAGGENLRAEPNGPILGRAATGMRLNEVERRGAWVRVRRTAWVREASLSGATAAAAPAPTTTAPPGAARRPGAADARPAGAAAGRSSERTTAGEAGAALLSAPRGDTLAHVRPFASLEVVARDGNWARVRADGWIWAPALRVAGDSAGVLRDVTTDLLVSNPSGFRGRVVELQFQFIALERAEKIRTDFYEGEPFILGRAAAGEGFVYVAVPEDEVDRVRRTPVLSTVRVVARVRTARSTLMGAPVLELLELLPARVAG